MRQAIVMAFLLASCVATKAQSIFRHGNIVPTPDGHYLQYEDGTPFFWLGDTGWELFHRLTLEEIDSYLENRKKKGFNVIQAVVLAEFDGLTRPNRYGDLPLINQEPETPNERYFELVDKTIRMASDKGLYMGLLPTWGDKVTPGWGAGPVVFNKRNAYDYGYWIAKRYRNYPNILWILGGDRPAVKDSSDWRPIWDAMANGILDASDHHAFITYHPSGGSYSTSQYIHHEPWLTMNMIQSGHGGGHNVATWSMIARDFNLSPHKPVIDVEPNYEDHPVNPWPKWDPASGYYRAYDVRKQLYRSVFAGACGVTYGHHSVWQFYSPREDKVNYADRYWTEALDRPGAFQAGHLRRLIASRPYLHRVPDQEIITVGQGVQGEYSCAFADSAGSYIMVYIPLGKKIKINTGRIKARTLKAWWFDPSTGRATMIGLLRTTRQMEWTTPTTGFGNDWVLVLDDPRYGYPAPGLAVDRVR